MAIIIGISGASGSGKSSVCNQLQTYYGSLASIISADRYYKAPSELAPGTCLDHPIAWDQQYLLTHLLQLKQNQATFIPTLSFNTPLLHREKELFQSTPIIIVDGVLLFYYPALRELLDFKIYIHASPDVCLHRRIIRDKEERNIDETITRQRFPEIFSAYQKYTQPTMCYANFYLYNDCPHKIIDIHSAIDRLTDRINFINSHTLSTRAKL